MRYYGFSLFSVIMALSFGLLNGYKIGHFYGQRGADKWYATHMFWVDPSSKWEFVGDELRQLGAKQRVYIDCPADGTRCSFDFAQKWNWCDLRILDRDDYCIRISGYMSPIMELQPGKPGQFLGVENGEPKWIDPETVWVNLGFCHTVDKHAYCKTVPPVRHIPTSQCNLDDMVAYIPKGKTRQDAIIYSCELKATTFIYEKHTIQYPSESKR